MVKISDCWSLLAPARSTICLLYTSPSPRDISGSRMPSPPKFHAEDVIRDPEMSRGLGDVYKRQQ
ncbi:hypothetical protein ACX3V1_22065 [Escherichia coli]